MRSEYNYERNTRSYTSDMPDDVVFACALMYLAALQLAGELTPSQMPPVQDNHGEGMEIKDKWMRELAANMNYMDDPNYRG